MASRPAIRLIGLIAFSVASAAHAQTPADLQARARAYYAWRRFSTA